VLQEALLALGASERYEEDHHGQQGGPDAALEPILRQLVVSLALVTPPRSSAA